ncbi:VTT domain-containing protein [Schauerella aestuarii]|uniref:VTT domain-containing protein n=1 Tax=Schauerella aestuarii TaxID=2511204 RepID=UPI001368B518|nr:VTT domain-containing protein [Achromobacter aestuarii]MYZ42397.1 hypothetical protein [Achromobacter aestuarii]
MDVLHALLSNQALWLLFLNVLVEQAGLPVPAYPSLVVAGALSLDAVTATPGVILALGVLACVVADSAWYFAGRRYGAWMMSTICRVSMSPDTCIRKSTHLYLQVGPKILLIAKFLPGAGALSTLMAGTVGTRYRTFLLYDLAGSAIWVASALMLGIVFQDTVQIMLALLASYVPIGIAIVVGALAAFIAWRFWRRRGLLRRSRRIPRLSVTDLQALCAAGAPVVVLDVRGADDALPAIPGAIAVTQEVALDRLPAIDDDTHLVIYCACPNEISAALLAERLQRSGVRRAYALLGGLAAWHAAQDASAPPAPLAEQIG